LVVQNQYATGKLNHKIIWGCRIIIVSGDECLKINLWELRTERGVTLRGLQELTGISKSRLSKIENQKNRAPDIIELEKIAIVLHCRITDLFESEYK